MVSGYEDEEEEVSMYLTNKYTQERKKLIARKVGKGEMNQFTRFCLSL